MGMKDLRASTHELSLMQLLLDEDGKLLRVDRIPNVDLPEKQLSQDDDGTYKKYIPVAAVLPLTCPLFPEGTGSEVDWRCCSRTYATGIWSRSK